MALDPTVVAIPLFLGLMALEGVEIRRERREEAAKDLPRRMKGYTVKDTATSISMGLGSLIVGALLAFITLAFSFFFYDHRLLDLGSYANGSAGWLVAAGAWLLLALLDDFCYYWFHRVHHVVRFFWAAHVVHHSSQYYNLSTALRQSWTGVLTGIVFYIPIFLLGFTPAQWAIVHGINLIYQFWIHTEAIGTMWRPFELIFNTPSHHRVHHGSNRQYLDRNFGGILIVFDRWFGSFEPEVEPVNYGLTKNIETYNPFKVAFVEYRYWFGDLARAQTWRERWMYSVGRPGWQPVKSEWG